MRIARNVHRSSARGPVNRVANMPLRNLPPILVGWTPNGGDAPTSAVVVNTRTMTATADETAIIVRIAATVSARLI
jgi:hypothetical protein